MAAPIASDPQTSGGLLVVCDQNRAAEMTKLIADRGYPHARIIGHAFSGRPAVTFEPAIAAERALVLLPFPSNYNRCSGDVDRKSAWLRKQVPVVALLDLASSAGPRFQKANAILTILRF